MQEDFIMHTEFYSLGDVAQLLRTQPHKIHYLLTTGQAPEPARRIGSRRIWTMEEILPLADKINQDKAAELQRNKGGMNV
jgi:DNA-binding transcriptional MerR regulator